MTTWAASLEEKLVDSTGSGSLASGVEDENRKILDAIDSCKDSVWAAQLYACGPGATKAKLLAKLHKVGLVACLSPLFLLFLSDKDSMVHYSYYESYSHPFMLVSIRFFIPPS